MALRYSLIEVDPKLVAPNPDNPSRADPKSKDFAELRDSIAAAGVQVPIAVRETESGPPKYQVLAGTRRIAAAIAAKMTPIPALNYGPLADDLACEISYLENCHHREVNPIRAGRAVATMLTRFGDDVPAVAARIGQTPHWVATHAQIERGLSADWKKEAVTNSRFIPWSAAHWIPICRLAPAQQAKAFKHFCGSACYDAKYYSVANVEQHLSAERRLLKDAAFATAACGDCDKRTGHAPLLWAAAAPEASGKKDRCLDPKCWDKKVAGAMRAEFDEKVTQHNYPAIVPLELSTADERFGNEAACKAHQDRKKAFGKALLQADQVEIVTEKTPGAKLALVVGGRGKGALKWVKKVEAAAGGTGGRAGSDQAAEAKQKRRDAAERKIGQAVMADLAARAYTDVGPDKALLAATLLNRSWELSGPEIKDLTAKLAAGYTVVDELIGMYWQQVTAVLKNKSKATWFSHWDYTSLVPIAVLFGFDLPALVATHLAAEKSATPPAAKKAKKAKKAASKRAR